MVRYRDFIVKLLGEFEDVSFNHLPRDENQMADALATLASMFRVSRRSEVQPIQMSVYETPTHCLNVKREVDGKPWYHDIMVVVQAR